MDKKMENDIETAGIQGFRELNSSSTRCVKLLQERNLSYSMGNCLEKAPVL